MTESGGQYILKPIPHGEFQHLDAVPGNEHLTMQIARQVFRIAVAENALVKFDGGEPAYLVRRFDVRKTVRAPCKKILLRWPAAPKKLTEKTTNTIFPTKRLASLIRKHVAAYPVGLERFFQLVVFNYFVHNGDAHLKNFSLIKNDAVWGLHLDAGV